MLGQETGGKVMSLVLSMRFLPIFFVAVMIGPSLAYGGGIVKGKVTFQGQPPDAEKFVFESFPNSKFCKKHPDTIDEGRRRVMYSVKTSTDGGLKDAIVYIQGLQDKQWMKKFESTNIDIRLCDFLPLKAVLVNGKNVRVVNHDADPDDPKAERGVAHTVRAYEVLKPRSKPIFSVGLPIKGAELNKAVKLKMWQKGSIVRLTCDQHEWMRSFLLPVQNPYYGIVDEKGTFHLENVPPERHSLVVWHPKLGKIEQAIEVSAGAAVEANFSFKGK